MANDLATLVGSRICHDLISPIGAISNGMELMEMSQGSDGAEIALINDSVHNANARIRFFRIAFGAARPEQIMAAREITPILDAMAQGGRTSYDWRIPDQQSRLKVRAAFLVILCLDTALPRGGVVRAVASGDIWTLSCSGEQVRFAPDLWDSVTNQFSRVAHTPAQVQFALLPEALRAAGLKFSVQHNETAVTVQLG